MYYSDSNFQLIEIWHTSPVSTNNNINNIQQLTKRYSYFYVQYWDVFSSFRSIERYNGAYFCCSKLIRAASFAAFKGTNAVESRGLGFPLAATQEFAALNMKEMTIFSSVASDPHLVYSINVLRLFPCRFQEETIFKQTKFFFFNIQSSFSLSLLFLSCWLQCRLLIVTEKLQT